MLKRPRPGRASMPSLLCLQCLLTQDLAEAMDIGPEDRQRDSAVEPCRTEAQYPVQSVVFKVVDGRLDRRMCVPRGPKLRRRLAGQIEAAPVSRTVNSLGSLVSVFSFSFLLWGVVWRRGTPMIRGAGGARYESSAPTARTHARATPGSVPPLTSPTISARNSGEYRCPPFPDMAHLLGCPNKKVSVFSGQLQVQNTVTVPGAAPQWLGSERLLRGFGLQCYIKTHRCAGSFR